MNKIRVERSSIPPKVVTPHRNVESKNCYKNGEGHAKLDVSDLATLRHTHPNGDTFITPIFDRKKGAKRSDYSVSSSRNDTSCKFLSSSRIIDEKLDILGDSTYISRSRNASSHTSITPENAGLDGSDSFITESSTHLHSSISTPTDLSGLSRISRATERIRLRRQQTPNESKEQIHDISSCFSTDDTSSVEDSDLLSSSSLESLSPPSSQEIFDKIDQGVSSVSDPASRVVQIGMDGLDDVFMSPSRKELQTFGSSASVKDTRTVRIGMDGSIEVVKTPSTKELKQIAYSRGQEPVGLGPFRSAPRKHFIHAGMSGLKTVLTLNFKQLESQRNLNILLQGHGYFDTGKTTIELRKKPNEAQQLMLGVVREPIPRLVGSRNRLSLKQQESQRQLNALSKSRGFFDTHKTRELPKKFESSRSKVDKISVKRAQSFEKAQLELASMASSRNGPCVLPSTTDKRELPLLGDECDEVSEEAKPTIQVSGEPTSMVIEESKKRQAEQMSYQDLEKHLREMQTEHHKLQQELIQSNEELKLVRGKVRNRIEKPEDDLQPAVATRQAAIIEYATDYDINDIDTRSIYSELRSRESALSQIIDYLQYQVEELQDEKANQKAILETELQETQMKAELAREQYDEAQENVVQLQEASANLQHRHERLNIRFSSTTQLWEYRADRLMDQVRELHLTLQDQTQMRMTERIKFNGHIALLEKENRNLRERQKRLGQGSNYSNLLPRGSSFLMFFRLPLQSLRVPLQSIFSIGEKQILTKNLQDEVLWHPTKSVRKNMNKTGTAWNSMKRVFTQGSRFLSSDVMKTAAWGVGIMGLAFVSDSPHLHQDTKLFLKYELISPFRG